jgi:hypothetical protein
VDFGVSEFESHPYHQFNNKMKLSLEHEEKYVELLRKRIQSKNFKENVSKEEFDKTKRKYDKAKLKLKMMREGTWK